MLRVVGAFLLASVLGACVAPEGRETLAGAEEDLPRSYWAARGFDLLDVVSARLRVGPGLLAHVRATEFVALGAGLIGRAEPWGGGFAMPEYGIGWWRREGGLWTERRAEAGISTFYYYESDASPIAGNRATFGPDTRSRFDIGADVHLALIGAAAEFRPDELLDFLAGIAGFDVLQDD